MAAPCWMLAFSGLIGCGGSLVAAGQDRTTSPDMGVSAASPASSPNRGVSYDRNVSREENQRRRAILASRVRDLTAQLVTHDRSRVVRGPEESRAENPETAAAGEMRQQTAIELEAWQRALKKFDIESICGPTDDSQDVELYDGKAGPTKQFVSSHQPATAQIQWNDDLAARFSGAGDDAGNVSGVRWCTGTLVSEDLLLTAGHCFDPVSADWRLPRRANHVLTAGELAPLMHVNFNYQVDGATGTLRPGVPYAISGLVEHRMGGLDYAIVRLAPSSTGTKPSSSYSSAKMDASKAGMQAARLLTIIQHPDGRPKRIAAGSKIRVSDDEITYADIDTLGGASGSGVIDQAGNLIGVHTTGGCAETGGANSGVTLFAISKASSVIANLLAAGK